MPSTDLALSVAAYVYVPGLECEAELCTRPPAHDVVWWDSAALSLHRYEVCAVHVAMMRRHSRTGALYFPLYGSPPLERVMHAIVQELARRRSAQQPWRPGASYGTTTYNGFTINVSSGFRWVGRI